MSKQEKLNYFLDANFLSLKKALAIMLIPGKSPVWAQIPELFSRHPMGACLHLVLVTVTSDVHIFPIIKAVIPLET